MGKEKLTITFRFNLGDIVWYMTDNRIKKETIAKLFSCIWDKGNGKYSVVWLLENNNQINDKELFASQLELINYLTGANL